ncbi:MAG: hypothetical protein GX808_06620 [Syntrophomonadaceae bacterium]|nr:hypothetical protein [Syntrophomonadaceae bacterium]
MNKQAVRNSPFSMMIRSSLSEKYGLAEALTRKCCQFYVSLHKACETRECREIAARFLVQTKAELKKLKELRHFELNNEYASFIRAKGLELETSQDMKSRLAELHHEAERLERIFSQLPHIDLSNSKAVYHYCLIMRHDLTGMMELLSEVSLNTRQQKELQNIAEYFQQHTELLAEKYPGQDK